MDDEMEKDFEGSGRGLILRFYPDIRLGRLGKTTKRLSQNCRSLGRDSNSGLPEYEARVSTTRPRRWAWHRVDQKVGTDVSEKHTVSNFSPEASKPRTTTSSLFAVLCWAFEHVRKQCVRHFGSRTSWKVETGKIEKQIEHSGCLNANAKQIHVREDFGIVWKRKLVIEFRSYM
jgi:hypothetical protein